MSGIGDERPRPAHGGPADPGTSHPDTTDPDPTGPDAASDGGDPVCWLALVCLACGALVDRPQGPVCERCGSPRDQGEAG